MVIGIFKSRAREARAPKFHYYTTYLLLHYTHYYYTTYLLLHHSDDYYTTVITYTTVLIPMKSHRAACLTGHRLAFG